MSEAVGGGAVGFGGGGEGKGGDAEEAAAGFTMYDLLFTIWEVRALCGAHASWAKKRLHE